MKLQIGSHLQHICSHCIVIIALIWWVMMKIRNEFQEIPVNVPSLSFPFRIFQQNPKMITERTTITIAEVIVKINKAAKWSGFLERGRSPMSDRFGLTAMAKMKKKKIELGFKGCYDLVVWLLFKGGHVSFIDITWGRYTHNYIIINFRIDQHEINYKWQITSFLKGSFKGFLGKLYKIRVNLTVVS